VIRQISSGLALGVRAGGGRRFRAGHAAPASVGRDAATIAAIRRSVGPSTIVAGRPAAIRSRFMRSTKRATSGPLLDSGCRIEITADAMSFEECHEIGVQNAD